MPGLNRCFRCGSVLEAVDGIVDVHPPRMPGWQKPFRGMFRCFRRYQILSERLPGKSIFKWMDRVTSDALVGLVFSIIPGLPHLVKGRFREVRWYVLSWAAFLFTGLFLFGSSIGYLLLSFALGIHVWIAMQFGLLDALSGFVERIMMTLMVTGGFAFVYWSVPRVAFHGYTAGHTALTIPDMRIQDGDYLLVRRIPSTHEALEHGTLVLFRPEHIRNNRIDGVAIQPTMIGQIVGVPGDTVKIVEGFYFIGNEPLDPERFPVPNWLRGRKVTVVVRPDTYFVSSAYTLQTHGNIRLADEAIRRVCLVGKEDIQGYAFMRWWPLHRRGMIE